MKTKKVSLVALFAFTLLTVIFVAGAYKANAGACNYHEAWENVGKCPDAGSLCCLGIIQNKYK